MEYIEKVQILNKEVKQYKEKCEGLPSQANLHLFRIHLYYPSINYQQMTDPNCLGYSQIIRTAPTDKGSFHIYINQDLFRKKTLPISKKHVASSIDPRSLEEEYKIQAYIIIGMLLGSLILKRNEDPTYTGECFRIIKNNIHLADTENQELYTMFAKDLLLKNSQQLQEIENKYIKKGGRR